MSSSSECKQFAACSAACFVCRSAAARLASPAAAASLPLAPPSSASLSSAEQPPPSDDAYERTVAAIACGDEMRRDHPHVVAALRAAPRNAVLTGAYALWRCAPGRDRLPLPFTPRIVVYGDDEAARVDAFRSVIDAVAAEARRSHPRELLCIVAEPGAGWTLLSAAWTHPLHVVLTEHATATDVYAAWGRGVDALGAFVHAHSVRTDGEARHAFAAGVVHVPQAILSLDGSAAFLEMLGLLGYRCDAATPSAAQNIIADGAAPDGDGTFAVQRYTSYAGAFLLAFPGGGSSAASEAFRYAPLVRCVDLCRAEGGGIGSPRSLRWCVEHDDAGESRYRLVTLTERKVCKRDWLASARYASVYDASRLAYPAIPTAPCRNAIPW